MSLELKKLIRQLGKRHGKLETELNRLWWTIANNSRSPQTQRASEIELNLKALYKDQSEIRAIEARLSSLSEAPDRMVERQYEVLSRNFRRERVVRSPS